MMEPHTISFGRKSYTGEKEHTLIEPQSTGGGRRGSVPRPLGVYLTKAELALRLMRARLATLHRFRGHGRADTPSAPSLPVPARRADSLDTHDLALLFRGAYGLCGSVPLAEQLAGEGWAKVCRRRHQGSRDPAVLLEALWERRRLRDGDGPAAEKPDDDARFVVDDPVRTPADLADVSGCYRALQRLPASERGAIVAIDVVGVPCDQAARVLKTTPEALGAQLCAARDRVAAEVELCTPARLGCESSSTRPVPTSPRA